MQDDTIRGGQRASSPLLPNIPAMTAKVVAPLSVILAAIPMGLVAFRTFGWNPRAYLPLIPLAALVFFRKPGRAADRTMHPMRPIGPVRVGPTARLLVPDAWPVLSLAPGSLLLLAGVILARPSLVWIGSFWNTLAVLHLHGISFAFPAPLLIFAVPPLASFASIVGGFSLRLWLSQVSAELLHVLDAAAAASGNIITFRGEAFAVDRLCEGMKMATASFLTSAVLARYASATGRWLILAATFPLWLGANLLRILALIFFRVPAEAVGHELIGLAFFAGMILFPLFILSLSFPARSKRDMPAVHDIEHPPSSDSQRRIALAVTALLCIAATSDFRKSHANFAWPTAFHGFERENVGTEPTVAIFHRAEDSLILKRDLFAPGTAHDPRICFEAAGFTFQGETEEVIGPFRVRSAHVEKSGKGARLLWWYAWSSERSPSDLDWRLARLGGHQVLQVNLYGLDDEALRQTALVLLQQHLPDGKEQTGGLAAE